MVLGGTLFQSSKKETVWSFYVSFLHINSRLTCYDYDSGLFARFYQYEGSS